MPGARRRGVAWMSWLSRDTRVVAYGRVCTRMTGTACSEHGVEYHGPRRGTSGTIFSIQMWQVDLELHPEARVDAVLSPNRAQLSRAYWMSYPTKPRRNGPSRTTSSQGAVSRVCSDTHHSIPPRERWMITAAW